MSSMQIVCYFISYALIAGKQDNPIQVPPRAGGQLPGEYWRRRT
jgi:hypothetical protein